MSSYYFGLVNTYDLCYRLALGTLAICQRHKTEEETLRKKTTNRDTPVFKAVRNELRNGARNAEDEAAGPTLVRRVEVHTPGWPSLVTEGRHRVTADCTSGASTRQTPSIRQGGL